MKVELTTTENNLLTKLVKDFDSKIAKSKKLSEEHQLILALAQKPSLSDSDVKKFKSLLAFEQSKITNRERKKKAKEVLKNHESEKKEIIENRYKRFGLVTIEALKKLPHQKATMSLADFLKLMIGEEDLNKTDKEWLNNFLVGSDVKVEKIHKDNANTVTYSNANLLSSGLPINENLS